MDRDSAVAFRSEEFCLGLFVLCALVGALIGCLTGSICAVKGFPFWSSVLPWLLVMVSFVITTVMCSHHMNKEPRIGEIITSSFFGYFLSFCILFSALYWLIRLIKMISGAITAWF